ncbi:MAG TPA: hypothetical protein ENJ06_01725 [Phycisphaeraceae bacterium]|nr:hypothetical protein [Phycisphaeraceae bacterium]
MLAVKRVALVLALLGASSLYVATVTGQTSSEPARNSDKDKADRNSDDSELNSPTVEQILKDLEKQKSGEDKRIRPTKAPGVENVTPGLPWIDPAQNRKGHLLLEGTFIHSRRGRLARSSVGGELYFVFDADAQGMQDPPMILLPCMWLEHMEKIAELRGDDAVFILSGEVKVYHNRNYLLPTWYQVVSPANSGLEE